MTDVNQLDSVTIMQNSTQEICKNCGSKFFTQAFAFRRLPKLITGTPKDQLVPMPVFKCADCGEPISDMLPEEEIQENVKNEDKGDGKIITL